MKKIIAFAALLVATPAFAQQAPQKPDAVVAACSELAARAERTAMTDRLSLVKYSDDLAGQLAASQARVKDLEAQLAKAKEPASATPESK
ncbi:hypothetical protein [Methylosinus sporium]|uniref:hypothetical protein n=1 Tax=Methylosinus sporium TaxID=428 RepID=UPI00383AD434